MLPFFSHVICGVLLDQVRCTEIDVKINGIVNEILNKGDITVTFDRPTHQEEFVLTDIADARNVGQQLGHAFVTVVKEEYNNPLWYKSKNKDRPFGIIEEIFPKEPIGVS